MMRKQISARAAQKLAGLRVSLAAVLVLLAAICPVVAQPPTIDEVIADAHGFEQVPPWGFTTTFMGTGQLEGQINPPGGNQLFPPGQWLRTKGPGLSNAVVQNAVFHPSGGNPFLTPGGGNQAVRVDKAGNSDDRWGVPVAGYPATDCICINWDMLVEQTVGPDETFGPFFGVEAYDDDATPVGLLGSLGVDATTGDVLFQAAGTGFLTETGSVVPFGTWNNYQIKLDYSTKEYSILLNGVPLGTIGFVDEANRPGGLNEFTDANISALGAAGDAASQALTGTAYFDNFIVYEGTCWVIPEPGTLLLAMMGVAVAGLGRRRRDR